MIDDFLSIMTDETGNGGERKSIGFSFSRKTVLPPTTSCRGVASASETHLLHVHKTTNLLLDLKCKVKRGVTDTIIHTQWRKCLKRINSSAIPASVSLLASDLADCPPYWLLDTLHSSLKLYIQTVDRANTTQRLRDAKCRLNLDHAFWKAFRPPRPRAPRVLRGADGQLFTDPDEMLEQATQYWSKIYNDSPGFNQSRYFHRYRQELAPLKRDTIDIPAITANDFVSFAKKMGDKAAGLDGRSASEVQALPMALWELVADFWENVRQFPSKKLPTQLAQAIVHLIPKPGAGSGIPLIPNLRPITVLPLLFRMWSGIVYGRLRSWMTETLPAGITGGKAQGEVAAIAIQLSMAIEESKSGLNPHDTFIFTTDFTKFFDSLNWDLVFSLSEHMGIPAWLCNFYRRYLGDLKRYFTFGGFFGPNPINSICGVPQGDALSLIWAAVGLSVWARLMEQSSSIPWDRFNSMAMAYIDDRYVIAHDLKNFYRLSKETIEHDKLAGFRLNLGKSALMASSASARRQLRNCKLAIPLKLSFVALGHAISSAARRSLTLVNTRFTKARQSLNRVRKSRITSKYHKGRAISGLCLPQASYGSWLAGVPTRAGRSLGSSFLRVLWGRGGHYRAKEIALSLLYPIHLVCPIIASDYTLLTTIARLARRHEHISHQISRLLDFLSQNRVKRYPWQLSSVQAYGGGSIFWRLLQLLFDDLQYTASACFSLAHRWVGPRPLLARIFQASSMA